MSAVLHVKGQILVSETGVRDELWVVDGRVPFNRPLSGDVDTVSGYVLPGLVDAHCHVGLEATGGVTQERAEEHAITDRTAGALLLRDAGSPVDTHWMDERDDLPRIIRAGRHIARTKRYIRTRSTPKTSSPTSARKLGAATGGSSSSVTGSTATAVTSRRAGHVKR